MLSTNIDTLIISVCCPLRAKSPSALRKIYSAAKLKFASVLTVQEKRGDSVFKKAQPDEESMKRFGNSCTPKCKPILLTRVLRGH